MDPLILVVEDEVLVRMLLSEHLREDGFRVAEAAHADEALEILLDGPFEVSGVVTDVRMPGCLNGLELADRIRSTWPHIAVIVTSAYLKTADNILPPGTSFLSKPYRPQAISERLRAALC